MKTHIRLYSNKLTYMLELIHRGGLCLVLSKFDPQIGGPTKIQSRHDPLAFYLKKMSSFCRLNEGWAGPITLIGGLG